MTYEYLGEDSSDVLSVAFAFQDAQRAVGLTGKGWTKSAGDLGANGMWSGDAALAATSDATKLGGILTETGRSLDTSQKALGAYATALSGLWSQVYDLNTELAKQQAAVSTANDKLQGLHSVEDRGTQAQQTKAAGDADDARTDITRANKNIGDLDDQYAGLKKKQSEAAHACIAALNPPAPGGPSAGYGGPLTLNTLTSILGIDKLDVAPLIQAEHISADLLSKKQPLDATDPKVQAEIRQLDGLLREHSGDPNFSTPYLKKLGPHNLLDLTGVLATMKQGDDGKTQPIMTTVGDLQHELGVSLASATHYLGGQPPAGTDQLSQGWLDQLKKQGESKFTFAIDDIPRLYQAQDSESVYGYSLLSVLMGDAHTRFAQPVLQQVGDDMMRMEQEYGKSHLTQSLSPQNSDGAVMWMSSGGGSGTAGLRLNWDNPDGQPLSTGADPFAGWTRAMSDSPEAARATMAGDNNLTNYLLNDRSWALNDGHVTVGGMGITDRVVDHPESNGTLKGFGDMLAHVDDPSDPNSTKMMENVVNDLGSNDKNHDLDKDFGSNDWIRPGLRGGVATLMSHHLGTINTSMSQDLDALPSANVQHVLQDLGKDETAYKTLYKSEAAVAGVWIGNNLHHGGSAQDVASAYGSVSAYLDHGADTAWAQDKTEGAARHNAFVDWAGGIFKVAASTGADAGLTAIGGEGAGPAVDGVIDKVTDHVLDGFRQDPSPEIQHNYQDTYTDSSKNVSDDVIRAVYGAMTPAEQNQIFHDHPPADLTTAEQRDLLRQAISATGPDTPAGFSRYADVVTTAHNQYQTTHHALGDPG